MKILEVDQWTSTGDVERYNFETFDLNKVSGGDSEAVRAIFGGHAVIREVAEEDNPVIGCVWFIELNGYFKQWKANYDSSD
jgi:hypothetical protein